MPSPIRSLIRIDYSNVITSTYPIKFVLNKGRTILTCTVQNTNVETGIILACGITMMNIKLGRKFKTQLVVTQIIISY